ncbi:MAG: cell division protein FtsK, partial [Candidatus Portnoybacteria bacterium CG10_big_fil_rev_8_21_14_0_10_36_7]
ILESDKGEPSSGDIQANATIIKRTLANFSIEVEMAEVNVGPTVTQYTLRPAQGIKLTKITGLANDLALSLAAHPIRIEAPIPGRSLVGIEIPNKTATKVRMRNLLASPLLQEKNSNLCLALGRDVAGIPIFPDLAKMPHLLIAGATGTGKTICLNALITSLLYQNTPENLRFILIDPKRVEFTPYMGIPHLLTPVILNPEKAVNALRWAVGEMERRFDVLSGLGARDITSYNNKLKAKSDEDLMPFIVIVIDELADLMSTFGREMEAAIVRIAQMARAVGIHLVLATQRPSVEVITGLIKANITTRIAFQVASQIDSRTILDSAGAEKLLGNGDLLLLSAESSKPRRVQGVFISEKEVKSTTDYLKDAGEVSYQEEIIQPKQSQTDSEIAGENSGDDELYGEARRTVIEAGKASASLLQRRLRVGYARAARLLDILESNGIIGPSDGAKPRDILIATPNEDSDIYSQEN